jgi:hypothetical protein
MLRQAEVSAAAAFTGAEAVPRSAKLLRTLALSSRQPPTAAGSHARRRLRLSSIAELIAPPWIGRWRGQRDLSQMP